MCGVVGSVSIRESVSVCTALKAMSHRGPDDSGIESVQWRDTHVVLGHARLSIIDLSHAGHQPMTSQDGRYSMVYNGELYNFVELRQRLSDLGHEFTSNSDSEVLLSAWREWGVASLQELVGMFAFAIVDSVVGTLHLVRDAFGIKPLYFATTSDSISFASEPRALMAACGNRKFDVDARQAYRYLRYGFYDDEQSTFLEGVRRLPPGHLMEINLRSPGSGELRRWWSPSIEEDTSQTFENAAAELRERFLENVGWHMRADVPLGAALSGGVDSSALVCAMRHLEPDLPIPTFSFLSEDPVFSEEPWVNRINAEVGASPHPIRINRREFFADLDDLIVAQGEPFGSTSAYAQFRVFREVANAGITVTLDGQGADELLAGYSGYPVARMRSLLSSGEPWRARAFLRDWSDWPGRSGKSVVRGLLASYAPEGLRRERSLRLRKHAWIRGDEAEFSPLLTDNVQRPLKGRHVASALRDALSGQGLQALLRHGDRNSMWHSIESRVPFLTTGIAEFLLRQPEQYLISDRGETKSLLRAALRGIVPDEILDRKDKIGFVAPQTLWMRQEREYVLASLDAPSLGTYVNMSEAREMVERFLSGDPTVDQGAVWRLVNFARWLAGHLSSQSMLN